MSRQGHIPQKSNDVTHNHWNNMTSEDKYKSTNQIQFGDASKDVKRYRPAEVFKKDYDTFDYNKSESNYKMKLSQPTGSVTMNFHDAQR